MARVRIYLGVHFPLHMAGALSLAAVSVGVCQRGSLWLAGTLYLWASAIDHGLFGPSIRRGWMPR